MKTLKKKKNYRDIVLINILDNIIQSLLKISLIWCNKLKCNFKYIYILPQKSIFILINKFCKKKKKIIIGVGACAVPKG